MENYSPLMNDISLGRRLNSCEFHLLEHCVRQDYHPTDLWDFHKHIPLCEWSYVGWAPAASTPLPNSGWGKGYSIAVLLERDNGIRVWFHLKPTEEMIYIGKK